MIEVQTDKLKPGEVYYDTPDLETCEPFRFVRSTNETLIFEDSCGSEVEMWKVGPFYTMDRIEHFRWRVMNGEWFVVSEIMEVLGVERDGAYWHTRILDRRRCTDRKRGVWEYGCDKSHSFS